MQNQVVQSGWKQLTSDENEDYLYKSFRMTSFSAALALLDDIGKSVLAAKLDKTTHLSVDASSITISINYPSNKPLSDEHYALALTIDTLISSAAHKP